jgi:tetratricopeptide (TPR) repeat protein
MSRVSKRRRKKPTKHNSGNSSTGRLPLCSIGNQSLTVQESADLAIQAYSTGHLTEAANICRQVLLIEPNHLIILHLLDELALQLDNNDFSADVLEEPLPSEQNDAETFFHLGNHHYEQGELEEAVANYHSALALNPNFAEAHTNSGNALQDLGRLDEALANFLSAIEIIPNYPEALCNLGYVQQELGMLDKASESYRCALNHRPELAEVRNNLGTTLQEQGKLDEAMASYCKAIAINPELPDVHFNLHTLLLDEGDLFPSIKCIEKAIDLNPDNTYYRFMLGVLLDCAGDTQAIAEQFDLVRKGDDLDRARLDAWEHLRTACEELPSIIGSSIDAFKIGIQSADIEGTVLEFGVRSGTSVRQIAELVDQDVHGFDSFEGLPETWHENPQGLYSTDGELPKVPENVILHKGWFEDTLPKFLEDFSDPVRFLNIDCDLYSSTKTVLDHLSDRICRGTVIVFDEYIGNKHWCEDEFKAFQEAVSKFDWNYEYLCFSFFTKQVAVRIV